MHSDALLSGEGSKDLGFLLEGLEATVSHLGRGVDELDFDLFGLPGLDGGEARFAEGDGPLADTSNTALEENVVVVDFTVVREAAHGGDVLLNSVGFSGRVVLGSTVGTGADAVDLLVDLSSGVVAELTATSDSPLDGSGMPSTNATNLAVTSVGLSWHSGDTEALNHTGHAFTLGDTDGVDALRVREHFTDGHLLFEFAVSPVDLLGDITAVHLDLKNVSLVLAEVELAHLGGAEHTHDRAVLLDALEVALDGALAGVILLEAVSVLGEGLLLGVHPVLVEAALDVSVELGSPDSAESAETAGSLSVTDETDDLHGRALDDGARVDNVLLDHLLAFTTLLVLHNVGHAGLVAHERGEVDGLLRVVFGEVSDATAIVPCASLGEVSEGARTRAFVFTVGHTK